MAAPLEERSPEETKQLARLAGAVYVSLGVASAFGFYHAPLLQGDLLEYLFPQFDRFELRYRPLRITLREPQSLAPHCGFYQRHVAGPGPHQRVADGELAPHVALLYRHAVRHSICAQLTGFSQRASIPLVVFTFFVLVAYIGANPGSATITSCPSDSRCLATHSLSVEASRRIRHRALPKRTAVNRSLLVAILFSVISP
jgi:hypothetical protein